jgi:hypothetical protein
MFSSFFDGGKHNFDFGNQQSGKNDKEKEKCNLYAIGINLRNGSDIWQQILNVHGCLPTSATIHPDCEAT